MSSCYNHNTNDIINELKPIAGEWQSYKGVKFNENWRFVNQNVIEGEGFSMNGIDTAFFEKLKIERVGDSIYYKVLLKDTRNSVDFLLTEATRNSWTFVNPSNDYPAIINYLIENDTVLTITTTNIRGNKKQFFYLNKVQ
jgi:hypothetical protein